MCKHCRWFPVSGLLVLYLRVMGCPCDLYSMPNNSTYPNIKVFGFSQQVMFKWWASGFLGFRVFTLCRMARLFGRFRATVWFRFLCWNKGMILHRVKTQKDHYTVLLIRAPIIFSLYKKRVTCFLNIFVLLLLLCSDDGMTAGLIDFMDFLHSVC
jgi:hypothetical protein